MTVIMFLVGIAIGFKAFWNFIGIMQFNDKPYTNLTVERKILWHVRDVHSPSTLHFTKIGCRLFLFTVYTIRKLRDRSSTVKRYSGETFMREGK